MIDVNDVHALARQQLQQAGARVTRPRAAVLAALLAAGRPLSHLELEQQLASSCDRVTLYRVLSWLVAQSLAHRISAEDRVWRFSAGAADDRSHAHFHCQQCGAVFCLEMPARVPLLPAGFRLTQMEMVLRGQCAECAA